MLMTLLGTWLFSGMFYQGTVMPPLNPNLQIVYQFKDDGRSRLFYQRKGEEGFCEREALFEVRENQIVQKIVWTHPNNAIWCDSDVDMQLGYFSIAPFEFRDGKFYLSVMMGEEEMFYIWDRQEVKN